MGNSSTTAPHPPPYEDRLDAESMGVIDTYLASGRPPELLVSFAKDATRGHTKAIGLNEALAILDEELELIRPQLSRDGRLRDYVLVEQPNNKRGHVIALSGWLAINASGTWNPIDFAYCIVLFDRLKRLLFVANLSD